MTLPTYNTNQWRIQGRGPRGLGPPLYLDQIEAQKAEKYFLAAPPSYLRVWMTTPPHPTPPLLSEGLRPPLLLLLQK